jgi:hypothetical protein
MKVFVLLAVAMSAGFPVLAQDQSSCKAYFQVLRGESGTPGLHVGMDSGQKRWWESTGQKKYPGLCLNGADMSGDKPRYLVIWSKAKTIGQTSPEPKDVYGQSASSLQATAPSTKIYQSRWDQAAVTVINVTGDSNLMLPPVYFETDQHVWILVPSSRKVLEGALKYLAQEPVFMTKSYEGYGK